MLMKKISLSTTCLKFFFTNLTSVYIGVTVGHCLVEYKYKLLHEFRRN